MLKRMASLAGMGMMAGLLCGIPSALAEALAVIRYAEPVRWVTPPGNLPGSQALAVASHVAGPPAVCAALGLLVGLMAGAAPGNRFHGPMDAIRTAQSLDATMPVKKELQPPEWAPWSFMGAGAVVLLYSFSIPRRVAG